MKFWLYLLLIPNLYSYEIFLAGTNRLYKVTVTEDVMTTSSRGISIPLTSDNHLGVTLSPNQNYIYVPNAVANTISIYQTSDLSLVTTINPGSSLSRPQSVAISPGGQYLYIINRLSNTISVVDALSYGLIQTINPGSSLNSPKSMAISPNGTILYVTNEGSNKISLIDLEDYSLIEEINPGSSLNLPFGIAFSPDGASLYVANRGNSTISVIDSLTHALSVSLTFSGTHSLNQIAFSPDGEYLYVTDIAAGSPRLQILSYPGHVWQSSVNPSGLFSVSPSAIAIFPRPLSIIPGPYQTKNFTSKRM